MPVSLTTLWTTLKKLGVTLEKKSCMRLSKIAPTLPYTAPLRASGKPICIHTSWFSSMKQEPTPKQAVLGAALRGQRVIDKVPHGHWKTTTFIGALRVTGMTAPMVVDGAMNGAVFLAYVQQQLVPTLRQGDTVIMDNLPAHKIGWHSRAMDSMGPQLAYLPPYSPTSTPLNWPSPS